MESMQSVLPSSVSPGWNDPPNLGCSAPNTPSARLTHLRKRLVDPSISGATAGLGQYPGMQQGVGAGIYSPAQLMHNSSVPATPEVSLTTPTHALVSTTGLTQNSTGDHYHNYEQSTPYQSQQQAAYYDSYQPHQNPSLSPQDSQQQYSTPQPFFASTTGSGPAMHSEPQPVHNSFISEPEQSRQSQWESSPQVFQLQHNHEAPPIRRA